MWKVTFNDILDPVLLERFDRAVETHCRQVAGRYMDYESPLGNLVELDPDCVMPDEDTIAFGDFVAAVRFASAIDFLAPRVVYRPDLS